MIAGVRTHFEVMAHPINRLLPLPYLFRLTNSGGFFGLRLCYPAAAVKFGIVDFSGLYV